MIRTVQVTWRRWYQTTRNHDARGTAARRSSALQMLSGTACHQWTLRPPPSPRTVRIDSRATFASALPSWRTAFARLFAAKFERRIERLNDTESIEFPRDPFPRSRISPAARRGGQPRPSSPATLPRREEIGQMQAVLPKRFAVEPSISVNPLRCSRFGMPPSSRSYSTCDCANTRSPPVRPRWVCVGRM